MIWGAHHAEGRVDPKVDEQNNCFGYPRECRFRKTEPLNQFRGLIMWSLVLVSKLVTTI
jgi:hypothetical protein